MIPSVTELDPWSAATPDGMSRLRGSVRVTHPLGETLEPVDSDVLCRSAFAAGGPRCIGCRDRDGRAASTTAHRWRRRKLTPARREERSWRRPQRGADLLRLLGREP